MLSAAEDAHQTEQHDRRAEHKLRHESGRLVERIVSSVR